MDESSARRFLVVDDEEVVRNLCSRVLSPLGATVETASDGEEAIRRFSQCSFDVLITDFRMPGSLDGLDLGRAIKAQFPQTQIIFMTAFPAMETALGMLRVGACDYLIKPFEPAELLRCVKACLANFEGV